MLRSHVFVGEIHSWWRRAEAGAFGGDERKTWASRSCGHAWSCTTCWCSLRLSPWAHFPQQVCGCSGITHVVHKHVICLLRKRYVESCECVSKLAELLLFVKLCFCILIWHILIWSISTTVPWQRHFALRSWRQPVAGFWQWAHVLVVFPRHVWPSLLCDFLHYVLCGQVKDYFIRFVREVQFATLEWMSSSLPNKSSLALAGVARWHDRPCSTCAGWDGGCYRSSHSAPAASRPFLHAQQGKICAPFEEITWCFA